MENNENEEKQQDAFLETMSEVSKRSAEEHALLSARVLANAVVQFDTAGVTSNPTAAAVGTEVYALVESLAKITALLAVVTTVASFEDVKKLVNDTLDSYSSEHEQNLERVTNGIASIAAAKAAGNTGSVH